MMNEDMLSFVWRFQYFDRVNLLTDGNSKVTILKTGIRNCNAGPDFSDARIQIDGVTWAGCVEIHVKSSDWVLHAHENDASYESVVLHVVWDNDRPVFRKDGSLLPTISLNGLVRLSILERYDQLLQDHHEIPCGQSFGQVNELFKLAMLDRVLLERLDKKASQVMRLLHANRQDWEETSYQWLAQHFGFKLNDPSFLRLSQIVPLKILQKHRNNLTQIEALLFGCAGLIPQNPDSDETDKSSAEYAYIHELRREYQFLASKYSLQNVPMNTHEWKFLRLRPAGFPTIRISQLAFLISQNQGIFASMATVQKIGDLQHLFFLKQSDYWKSHFQFGKLSKSKVPAMGINAANLLIINAVVPLMVAHSKQRQQPEMLDKALEWLSAIPSENNRITREWLTLGMKVKNAADSQSLIEWFNHYCTPKKCLDCTVGAALVRSV